MNEPTIPTARSAGRLSAEQVQAYYESQVERYAARLAEIERLSGRMTWLRVGSFLAAAVVLSFAWANPPLFWFWIAGSVALFVLFVTLVRRHDQLLAEAAEVQHRRRMNRIQQARLSRNWDEIPELSVAVPPSHRALARDLDLAGPASVFQLISLAHTPIGRATLLDWLLEPSPPDEVRLRQEAVAALAPEAALREELDLRGRQLGAGESGPVEFVQWAEGPPWLAERGWLLWLARGLAAGAILSVAVALAVSPLIGWSCFAAVLAVNLVVNVLLAHRAIAIFSRVSSRNHSIQHYRALFQVIAELPAQCSFLQRLKDRLGSTPREPIEQLDHLMRIVSLANLRRDSALGIVYLLLQLTVLIDFHLLHRLERWQQAHGHGVRHWLSAVGQLEAVSSLATLAHDHADWAMPDVEPMAEPTIQAVAIGHPLIPDQACVRNDVTVGPTGTFLLVTGSNMSGKSTLLRSLGVNVALAQAGGPVCAAALRLPPLQLATSMRIDDSLAEGVSFFMAELKRLKQIVDQCREIERVGQWTLLYLLDEILQGTNSAERHIAVSQVIGHLVRHGAIGAVSTHDLELAGSPQIAAACQTVHFRESFDGEGPRREMTFDHKMRPGVTPTTNALKLLELVGLGEQLDR